MNERSRLSWKGGIVVIAEQLLNQYRLNGTLIRVIRDANGKNDVKGTIVAWNEDTVLLRKRNRKVVKLSRAYTYQPVES